jgi:hypothetical protein
MGTARKPPAGAGEQKLRELANEITDPVGEYRSVAVWHRRALAALDRWMGSDSARSREFEALADDLVLPDPSLAESWDVHNFEERFRRATGVLMAAAEDLQSTAPEMDTGKLHSWVWESAAPLWRTKHFTQAVSQAAIRVNTETQAKVGRRDITETDLFNQVFSLDEPKIDAPRLRLMEDDGSKTYKSVHRGARSLAEGLYAGVRNPASHEILGDLDEQHALEQLAAFSLLARWVDAATVETASPLTSYKP